MFLLLSVPVMVLKNENPKYGSSTAFYLLQSHMLTLVKTKITLFKEYSTRRLLKETSVEQEQIQTQPASKQFQRKYAAW